MQTHNATDEPNTKIQAKKDRAMPRYKPFAKMSNGVNLAIGLVLYNWVFFILLSYLSKFFGSFGKNNLPQIIADIPPMIANNMVIIVSLKSKINGFGSVMMIKMVIENNTDKLPIKNKNP